MILSHEHIVHLFLKGEWISGVREGQGIILYSNGNIYEGEWRGDQRHGRGRYTHTAQGYLQVRVCGKS